MTSLRESRFSKPDEIYKPSDDGRWRRIDFDGGPPARPVQENIPWDLLIADISRRNLYHVDEWHIKHGSDMAKRAYIEESAKETNKWSSQYGNLSYFLEDLRRYPPTETNIDYVQSIVGRFASLEEELYPLQARATTLLKDDIHFVRRGVSHDLGQMLTMARKQMEKQSYTEDYWKYLITDLQSALSNWKGLSEVLAKPYDLDLTDLSIGARYLEADIRAYFNRETKYGWLRLSPLGTRILPEIVERKSFWYTLTSRLTCYVGNLALGQSFGPDGGPVKLEYGTWVDQRLVKYPTPYGDSLVSRPYVHFMVKTRSGRLPKEELDHLGRIKTNFENAQDSTLPIVDRLLGPQGDMTYGHYGGYGGGIYFIASRPALAEDVKEFKTVDFKTFNFSKRKWREIESEFTIE